MEDQLESYIVYWGKGMIKRKQYLMALEKYYMADIGLRNVMLNSRGGQDVRHILASS